MIDPDLIRDAIRHEGGVTRRAMLRRGALLLGGLAGTPSLFAADPRLPSLRFGAVTDIHYADKPPKGSRFYRESPDKLSAGLKVLNDEKPAFIVELGDLIDKSDDIEEQIGFLQKIDKVYGQVVCDRHYVLGNHCVETLTKEEFLGNCGAHEPHYSFDHGEFHFVILDSCFRSDGVSYGRNNHDWKDANIPEAQLEWLRKDLGQTGKPVIVLVHQRLDGEGSHYVNNAAAVQAVMAKAGNVLAVLQGHSHQNDYRQVDGIHFCTLAAVVEGTGEENNGASLVSVFDDGSICIEGFFRQANYDLTRTASPAQ